MPAQCEDASVRVASAARLSSTNPGFKSRSSGGYPGMANSGKQTTCAPAAYASSATGIIVLDANEAFHSQAIIARFPKPSTASPADDPRIGILFRALIPFPPIPLRPLDLHYVSMWRHP